MEGDTKGSARGGDASTRKDIVGSQLGSSSQTRNVNTNQYLGELPSFLSTILEKMSLFQKFGYTGNVFLDQLTVNEYPPGVGLSPHIDTHSAFEGLIFSLSLAGPCIMELRKYSTGVWPTNPDTLSDEEAQNSDKRSKPLKRAIYLPPRSMLLLSGEARYAWHHYIPHHKLKLLNWEERPLLNVSQAQLLLNKLQGLSMARLRRDFVEADLPSDALSTVRL